MQNGNIDRAIAEAADRMEELARQVEQTQHYAPTTIVSVQDQLDGANAAILDLTDQLLKANTRVAELETSSENMRQHGYRQQRARLLPYIMHKRGCGLEALGECDCGLNEALNAND